MRLRNIVEKTFELNGITGTTNSEILDMSHARTFSLQCIVDVDTPAADTFAVADVTVAADTATITGHAFVTGLKGQLTTTDTLPAGLSLTTDYFIIVVDADTIQFASTLANALAGTAITLTDAGVGTHTFTPTALAGATVTFQRSNDGVTFDNLATATNITVDANFWYTKVDPEYRWARLQYTLTAGSMSTINHILIKGE